VCIMHSPQPMVYAYSWYLDIVCSGWEGLVAGDYEAVFPLTRNQKLGIHYLYQPFFTQQLGLFSRSKDLKYTVEGFLSAVPPKYKYIDICLNESNFQDLKSIEFQTLPNYLLDLSNSYEEIYDQYQPKCRKSIRHFVENNEKQNFAFAENVDPNVLIHLFREYLGEKVPELNEGHYHILESLIMECLEMNLGEIWLLHTSNGMPYAGVFFLDSPGRKIYLFAATSKLGRENNAMFFLLDEFIHKYHGQKLLLDFEGSSIPGLAHFYEGFGARRVSYPQVRINKLPRILRWIKPE